MCVPEIPSIFCDPINWFQGRSTIMSTEVDTSFRFNPRTHPRFDTLKSMPRKHHYGRSEYDVKTYKKDLKRFKKKMSRSHQASLASSWTTEFDDAFALPKMMLPFIQQAPVLGGIAGVNIEKPTANNDLLIVIMQADASTSGKFIDARKWYGKFNFLDNAQYVAPPENELIGYGSIGLEKLYIYPV